MALSSSAQSRPVAFCQLHGLFDQDQMVGATVSCPDCGRDARVLGGADRLIMLRAHRIIDSAVTIEAVFDMRDLLERVQRGEVGPDPAIAEALKIDRRFGRVMSQALRIEVWPVPALISMLSLYFRLKDDYSGKAQIANLMRIMERQAEPLERLSRALGIVTAAPATTPMVETPDRPTDVARDTPRA